MNEITSFGGWVKQRRLLLNLSQAELAQRVGCAVITIKKIEQDQRRPSQQMAELLADHLFIPPLERQRFINIGRGHFVTAVPTTESLRLPPFLQKDESTAPPLFVGRQKELVQLQAHLDQALAGTPQFIFICGEAGRGKTSLLAEFARQSQLSQANLIVAGGTCSAQGNIGDPYLPFRDLLALLTGSLEAPLAAGTVSVEQARRLWSFLPHALSCLAEHGPDLLQTLVPGNELLKRITPYLINQPSWLAQLEAGLAYQPAQQGQLAQHQLFEQVRQLWQKLTERQPLLFLFDDLQWIDSASLNLLFHLGRRLTSGRLMFVGAYRASEVKADHPLTPVIGEFQRRLGHNPLDLEKFDPQTSRQFVDALLDSESNQLGEQFRERLFWHTKGHPLFTVELLRHLQTRGDLIRDENGRWIEHTPFTAADLPVRVEAIIKQRLNQLDAPGLALLRAAAVEGEVFTAQVVARIEQIDERSALQLLASLERDHSLIREHGELQGGSRFLHRYQFRHALFQHFLYTKLSQGERRLLHTAVAEALIAHYRPHTAEIAVQLAYHFSEAGAVTEAAVYHRLAGDRALKGAALTEAIGHYRAALLGVAETDSQTRAETLHQLGECLLMAGQTAAALPVLQNGFDLFAALENRLKAGAVLLLIGRTYWEQGERAISLQHYHRALHILQNEPAGVELARAMSAISQMHMLASENEQAITWGERALHLAQTLNATEVIVHASNNVGVAMIDSSQVERGTALLQESLQMALKLNLPHEACRAHVNLGESLNRLGEYAAAQAIFDRLLTYSTQVGAAMFQGVALVRLTDLDWIQDRWADALTRCAEIKSWQGSFEWPSVPKVWASTLLGRIYNDLGQPNLAYDCLLEQLDTARRLSELQTTVPHLGQMARVTAVQGQEAETLALIQEILALVAQIPTDHVDCIATLLFAHEWTSARQANRVSSEIAEICLRHLQGTAVQFRSEESLAALAEVEGVAAAAQQDWPAAQAHFSQAVAGWQKQNRPFDQARALLQLGSIEHPDDTAEAKISAFVEARHILESLAEQIPDVESRASFLNSNLGQETLSSG